MRNGKSRKDKESGIGLLQILRQVFRKGIAVMMAALLFSQPLEAAGSGTGRKGSGAEPEQGKVLVEDKIQRYPVLEEYAGGNGEDYIALSVPDAVYKVKQGDTLWGIARQSYGTGSAWERIKAANPGAVGENALILTGAELQIPQTYYLEKQEGSRGGFSSPACSYDMPADWVYAYAKWEVCLEAIYPTEHPDSEVCVHITENRMFPEGVGEHWEEMQEQIKESTKKESAKRADNISFSEPCFERYYREDGRELIFYSFICKAGEEEIQFAAAYVTGRNYLAEFIGYCPLEEKDGETTSAYAIEEITRYMAASFTETDEEKSWSSLKYRPYLGYEDWAYEDLHNPFAIAAKRYVEEEPIYDGEDKEIQFVSEEWEDLIRMTTAYHYDMTDEEWEEFSERPVRTGDVAWITEVSMVDSPIPGRDTVTVGGLSPRDADCTEYHLTTLRDMAVLPNLEKLELEIGSVSDYEVLAECPSLREISIVSAKPLTEMEWLKELPKLESLTLRTSMLSYLSEMGYLGDGESTFTKLEDESGSEKEHAEEGKMTLAEVLEECTGLKYLELESADMEDFDFIRKLPNLYAFRLCTPEHSEETLDRSSLFGANDYPQVKCLVVDDKWLRNPE